MNPNIMVCNLQFCIIKIVKPTDTLSNVSGKPTDTLAV